MAAGSVNDIILDDFLTCQICFEIYKEPKILKCLHSFCNECVAQCIKKPEVNIVCPLCRDISNLPQNGVTSLKSNFYIKNLIDVLNTTSNVNRCQWHCSYCEISGKGRANATAKCLSCYDFLCQTCAGNHNGTRMTMNHQVVSISDLTAGKFNSHVRSKQEIPCSKHVEETIRYLCESCNVPVCRDCVLLDHRQHKCVQISEAVTTRRSEIEETLKSLEKKLETMKDSKQTFDEKLEELSTKETSYIENVKKTTEVVIQNVRKECERTQQLIKEQFIAPKKYIQDLKTAIETKTKDLDDSLKFCRKVIQDGRDAEILFLLETMKERLTKLQHVEVDHLSCQMEEPSLNISKIFRDALNIFHIQFPTKILHCTGVDKSKDNNEKSNTCKEESASKVKNVPEVNPEMSAIQTVGTGNLEQPPAERTNFVLELVRKIDLMQMKEKCSPKITCVCGGKDNTFYAVDCSNSKLTQYSSSGEFITSINVKQVITAAQCESCLVCGSVSGKISTVSENGWLADTGIPILNRSTPMCSIRNKKSVVVMGTYNIFTITEGECKEISLKDQQGKPCHINPMFISDFKESQYLVSDWKSSSLLFIDSEGNIYKDYFPDIYRWAPGGVVTDSSDYIYVLYHHDSSLHILNPDGQHVQTIYLKPLILGPRSISIVQDGRFVISGETGIAVYDINRND